MATIEDDRFIRTTVFQFLAERTNGGADPISWSDLQSGCMVGGERVTIIGQKGIWKPKQLDLPISIITAPEKSGRPKPYKDEITEDGLLTYRYEGTNTEGYRNQWLRRCMNEGKGLVYLHGVAKGWYHATWPVYVFEDHPAALSVRVILADPGAFRHDLDPSTIEVAERRYYASLTKRRLHQADFRERVLTAYGGKCGFCRLKHRELLDAAHIRPDSAGGSPATSNGLSLCKIHHAAFDHRIVGIRPDHVLQIRQDVLNEIDGPMLRYGLQALNGERLILPKAPADRPDPEALEERYELFANG